MDAFTQTARENHSFVTSKAVQAPAIGSQSGRVASVADATRRVINALEGLRISAEAAGDSLALINAGIAMDMLQGLRAGRH